MVIESCCDFVVRSWLVLFVNVFKIRHEVSLTETGWAIAVVTGDRKICVKSSDEILC